jgi:hypothetical protein
MRPSSFPALRPLKKRQESRPFDCLRWFNSSRKEASIAAWHIARKNKAFVDTVGGQLRLPFLLPYSPDRDTEKLVCNHLKADKIVRGATVRESAPCF